MKLPINPAILIWARESANLPIEEVALRMKKSADVVEAWEEGHSSPTYVQLERLAYTVYKRPVAVFFLPEPPEEITAKKSFRTLPESEVEELPPRFLRVFRRGQAMQLNLEELTDGRNPAPKKILRDLSFKVGDDVRKMVESVREYLGISVRTQARWANTRTALEKWRRSVEDRGIFVFKDAFRDDEFSGFCIYDQEYPLVYINSSMPETRQIFTLFHELIHLLFKTGGVDKQNDAFIRRIRGDNRRIEVLCNRFAGEFLVPKDDFDRAISGVRLDEEVIKKLAKRYKVSREVILRKCLDRKLVTQAYYEKMSQQWIKEARERARRRTGGNYYTNVSTYLGETYLNLAFKSYYRNKFSIDQLAEYLGVKVTSISGLEMAFLGRG